MLKAVYILRLFSIQTFLSTIENTFLQKRIKFLNKDKNIKVADILNNML